MNCPIKLQAYIITTHKSNTSDLYTCRCTGKKCIIMHCSISEVFELLHQVTQPYLMFRVLYAAQYLVLNKLS